MKRKIYILTFLFIILSKVFFNDSGDESGSFQASTAAYQVAVLNLSYIMGMMVLGFASLAYILRHTALITSGVYYLYALCSTVYSAIPLVTAFRGVMGLGFFYVVTIIVREFRDEPIESLVKFLWCILISSFFSSLIFYIGKYGYKFVFGVPSGYSALIASFLIQYYAMFMKTSISKFVIIIILFIAAIFMKSFSAIIALYISFMFIFFMRGSVLLVTLMIVGPTLVSGYLYTYMINNPEILILGKPAGAYLIGSGRFALYEAAIDLYFNKFTFFQSFFGVGFMADREYLKLYDLTWSSDPHNSLILSSLGIGIVGAILYFIFVVSPFLQLRLSKYRRSKIYVWGLSVHLGAVVYGVTSSGYLGIPSVLFIASLSCLVTAYFKAKYNFN